MNNQPMQKKQNNYDKILTVNCNTVGDFFTVWLKLIPMLKLNGRELMVASKMLEHWYRLSKKYNDINDVIIMFNSQQERQSIAEECEINVNNFNVNLTSLKKLGFCYNYNDKDRSIAINKRYIPDIKDDDKSFCFILNFKINEGV